MLRRALASLLAAAFLVLAPAAALAGTPYPVPTPGATVSNPNPGPGEPVTVDVSAPDGAAVSLVVTGPCEYREVLDEIAAGGQASVWLMLSREGVYQVAVTVGGDAVETLSVTVGDGDAGDCEAADGEVALPETGAPVTPILIGGLVVLLLGAALVYVVRRRRNS